MRRRFPPLRATCLNFCAVEELLSFMKLLQAPGGFLLRRKTLSGSLSPPGLRLLIPMRRFVHWQLERQSAWSVHAAGGERRDERARVDGRFLNP
jgi:hypothetical protein